MRLRTISLLLLLAAVALGEDSARQKTFVIMTAQEIVCCIEGPSGVPATETRIGNDIYEVFWSRTTPKRELFRVRIGRYVGSEAVKWWKYGVAAEEDLNGDGFPDYVWYGGDDTSFSLYLFLSSGSRYVRVDVLKTVKAAWQRRFRKAAPEIERDDAGYVLGDTVLERSPAGLVLSAKVDSIEVSGAKKQTYQFQISQPDFKQ